MKNAALIALGFAAGMLVVLQNVEDSHITIVPEAARQVADGRKMAYILAAAGGGFLLMGGK